MQKALTSDVRPKCGESVKKVYGGFTYLALIRVKIGRIKMSDKLKPCPLRGGKAKIIQDKESGIAYGYGVKCRNCGNGASWYTKKQSAIGAWNRRVEK